MTLVPSFSAGWSVVILHLRTAFLHIRVVCSELQESCEVRRHPIFEMKEKAKEPNDPNPAKNSTDDSASSHQLPTAALALHSSSCHQLSCQLFHWSEDHPGWTSRSGSCACVRLIASSTLVRSCTCCPSSRTSWAWSRSHTEAEEIAFPLRRRTTEHAGVPAGLLPQLQVTCKESTAN